MDPTQTSVVWAKPEFWTAVCTFALALGTFYLAWQTQRLAKETLQTERQSERQHQESLMPLLKLTRDMTVDINDRFSVVSYRGQIVNTGVGPALDITVIAVCNLGNMYTISVEPLGIGDTSAVLQFEWETPGRADDIRWRIQIDYHNVFNGRAGTAYNSANETADFSRPAFVKRAPSA